MKKYYEELYHIVLKDGRKFDILVPVRGTMREKCNHAQAGRIFEKEHPEIAGMIKEIIYV